MVGLSDIISYFTEPYKEGYTVSKTAVFAILFVIAAYVIYEILKKLKINIDKRLAVAVAPFVLLGSTARVLVDKGTISNPLYVTLFTSPNIYIIIAGFAIATLLISVFLERRKIIAYHKPMFIVGLFAAIFAIVHIQFVNIQGIFLSLGFWLPWLVFAFVFKKWSPENRGVLGLQMLDANATFVTLNFFGSGYVEQHVVPNLFINAFGPFSFVIVKAVAIVTVLILIDRFSDDKDFNNYMKLVIAILGAATGTGDFLRLSNFV